MKLEHLRLIFKFRVKYLFIILSLGVSYQAHAADVIVGIADQHRQALSFKNGRFVGTLAKYYQCPFDESGLSFNFQVMPHQRVLLKLQRGDISLGLPLAKTESRDKFAIFTRSLLDIPFSLYTRRNINLSNDLSAYTFAVVRNTASVDLVAKHKAKFIEVNNWTQALALANLGRYDGAVIPEVVIKGLDIENFEGLTKLNFGSIPTSMYVSRQIDKTEGLAERLNAAIDACQL